MDDIDRYSEMILEKLEGYQFSTFKIGSTFWEELLKHEKNIHTTLGVESETLKKEFNREVGKVVSLSRNATFEPSSPEMDVLVDTRYDSVSIRPKSVYVYGVYRKRVRGIPQTRWIHDPGNGETVESIIGEPLRNMLDGRKYYLHGAGREDVDVRMLGNGREFVIEISEPKRRDVDLKLLRTEVNRSGKVWIAKLRSCDRDTVVRVKNSRHDKRYRVVVASESNIDRKRFQEAMDSIIAKDIYQRTPLRVSHRRADLIRVRHIRDPKILSLKGKRARIELTAEAGTYIKELISGDSGRTKPSLTSEYGDNLRVSSLDVIWIYR